MTAIDEMCTAAIKTNTAFKRALITSATLHDQKVSILDIFLQQVIIFA